MKKSLINFYLTFICLFVKAFAYGQNGNISVYATFDRTIQARNAAFNNGKIHFNPYRSSDKTFRYYQSPDYLTGNIIYDGQIYGNVNLKYDLLNDELIIKFEGENNQMGFNVIKQKTNAFYIGGMKFTNLDLIPHPDFVSGFYEETDAGNIRLYTKFSKEKLDVLTSDKIHYTYKDDIEFIFNYGNKWFVIDSQRDTVNAFPSYKKEISGFFKENAPLERADRKQFMKKLAAYLGQLLNTNIK